MKLSVRQEYHEIARQYRLRKAHCHPNLLRWEYAVQMLISAYLSWRWLGRTARFRSTKPAKEWPVEIDLPEGHGA